MPFIICTNLTVSAAGAWAITNWAEKIQQGISSHLIIHVEVNNPFNTKDFRTAAISTFIYKWKDKIEIDSINCRQGFFIYGAFNVSGNGSIKGPLLSFLPNTDMLI